MMNENIVNLINVVLDNMPADWIRLTTHRLDIYNEELAKTEFLEHLERAISSNDENLKEKLSNLPTAFDYIRLGHPLSCVLEWAIAKDRNIKLDNVITFSSSSMPVLAILRKNHLDKTKTQIIYKNELPTSFDEETLKSIYGYSFDLVKSESTDLPAFDGTTILITDMDEVELVEGADFSIGIDSKLGSITLVNGVNKEKYISEIQHVRRRESIAMTPRDCLSTLERMSGREASEEALSPSSLIQTQESIKSITNSAGDACLGSSGLSVQYAIMMGLIDSSLEKNPGKDIKFIVPPNCYGGTNDQARRVAACLENVEILDLPVDSGRDMVTSVEKVLDEVAKIDAIAFIIAEIPTNPRVEVPDLERLKEALAQPRRNQEGNVANPPVFILDQTFCPNVKFLGEGDYLSSVETISYVSGSKFPSGGLCTAGYCVANSKAQALMPFVEKHLKICGNEATDFQIDILAKQMPSMVKRINDAYKNTRGFVNHIQSSLPDAKINFVSEELASAGFTPSVFSLDLPTKGESDEERENYKRELNHKLIKLMISEIPNESKHCVSYGQLQGCYWTIPATSTQGTTKEGDKDYIVRVSLAPKFDLNRHNEVFTQFCNQYIK